VTLYTPRVVDAELDELLRALPALAIEGAKGVGKTATAQRRVRTVFRFDEPALRQVACADPTVLFDAALPVLLDEWQHVPAVWDAVRRAVDDDPTPNRILLTGSVLLP
jgi:predicted AAA+ superfamily ATPase